MTKLSIVGETRSFTKGKTVGFTL